MGVRPPRSFVSSLRNLIQSRRFRSFKRPPLGPVLAVVFLCFCLSGWCDPVVYVDQNAPGPGHDGTSWDTAFLTIQEGVYAATPGGDVWVADGVYVENVVVGEGVAIYGGFLGAEPGGYEDSLEERDFESNVTTIDGNQSGTCVTMADDSRVDGFTITNGSGTQTGDGTEGGGALARWLERPGTITNNKITRNSADAGAGIACGGAIVVTGNSITENATNFLGGGVSCFGYPPAIISDNTIASNSARGGGGGVYCGWLAEPFVVNNVITGNWTANWGGGILCQENQGSPVLAGNVIADNAAGAGGGICCRWRSSPLIINNTIERNSAVYWGGGILVFWRGYPTPCTIATNVIADNTAGKEGGGISCHYYSEAVVAGNSIIGNACEGNGGGMSCSRTSSATVANNIVADNQAGQDGGGICCSEDSSAALVHNGFWANVPDDYYGCEPGEGDISADPLFVDPENGDFHLLPESPCIDAGCNDYVVTDEDIDGDPRIIWAERFPVPYWPHPGYVDIGADEFVPGRFESLLMDWRQK